MVEAARIPFASRQFVPLKLFDMIRNELSNWRRHYWHERRGEEYPRRLSMRCCALLELVSSGLRTRECS
jgi:hypothetical protein